MFPSKASRPLRAAALGLALLACGQDDPLEPSPPTAIASVSGDGQEGKAGDQLSEPFVVRVTDARGDGVGGVAVSWEVTSGTGHFAELVAWVTTTVRRTDTEGLVSMFFRPTHLGTSTVVADLDGVQGSPVVFAAEVTGMVIRLGTFDGCEAEPYGFIGPDGSTGEVTVPIGTPVEWTHAEWESPECRAHLASISVPSGGEAFDSGLFLLGERFRFVPRVAGTWEYADRVAGGSGRLTAR